MGRGGQVASFEALIQGDDLEANNPAPNGLALGNEQALCAYADRAVAVTQQAGGEAHTTGRDGRLRLQAYPLADPCTATAKRRSKGHDLCRGPFRYRDSLSCRIEDVRSGHAANGRSSDARPPQPVRRGHRTRPNFHRLTEGDDWICLPQREPV